MEIQTFFIILGGAVMLKALEAFLRHVLRAPPPELPPLQLHQDRLCDNLTGLDSKEFAVHCAVYAHGWGAGWIVRLETTLQTRYPTQPYAADVFLEHLLSWSASLEYHIQYRFHIESEQCSVKEIFNATLYQLTRGSYEEKTVSRPVQEKK